jgi:hypothetical protein
MKKTKPKLKVPGGMAYSDLFVETSNAFDSWSRTVQSLQGSLCIDDSNVSVDPFALLGIIKDIRSRAFFVAQIGETVISAAETWALEATSAAMSTFDQDLRRRCSVEGIGLQGSFPSYVVDGFLVIHLSAHDAATTIGGKKVGTRLFERVWQEVHAAVHADRACRRRPEEVIALCYEAYRRALALRVDTVGASIPIASMFRELVIAVQSQKFWKAPQRSSFSEYSEETFSRDLARLISEGLLVAPSGARMELMPTAFAKDGIPVRLVEGIRYIGHVSFGTA